MGGKQQSFLIWATVQTKRSRNSSLRYTSFKSQEGVVGGPFIILLLFLILSITPISVF